MAKFCSTGESMDRLNLKQIREIPEPLFTLEASELFSYLKGPTLLHLNPEASPPLVIATLLHGNETSGWLALREFWRQLENTSAQSYIFLLGNLEAAATGKRFLPHQPDFNRIWSSDIVCSHSWAEEALTYIAQNKPLAAIDIHNTTGRHRPYAAISHLNSEQLFLTRLLTDIAVHYKEPRSTLSGALAEFCPSLALECGQVGSLAAREFAKKALSSFATIKSIGRESIGEHHLTIYSSFARVFVPDKVEFDFQKGTHDKVNFSAELDLMNLQEIPVGTVWGTYPNHIQKPLFVQDNHHNDRTSEYFKFEDGYIVTTKAMVPSLISTSPLIVHQDCLGYVMERV